MGMYLGDMATAYEGRGLSASDAFIKRTFDLAAASIGLTVTWWLILGAAVLATIDTGRNGFFVQTRIGRHGKPFKVIKIRTMRDDVNIHTTVTVSGDARVTRLGSKLRKAKIDELPQLLNVLVGQMSLVGPRPDIPGFADILEGEDRIVLSVRPGITGPASLYYRDEESLLKKQPDPEKYNEEVIYPHKLEINKKYIREYSFRSDLFYIFDTLFG